MRKHQYRGQRVDTKEWVYGYYVKKWIQTLKKDGRYEHYIVNQMVDENEHIWNETFQVIPETVGEFTGRKDINGIGAYEGDICETIERDVAMEIRWDEELSAFKFYDNVHKLWFDLDCLEVVEITDSIHDNQELIK